MNWYDNLSNAIYKKSHVTVNPGSPYEAELVVSDEKLASAEKFKLQGGDAGSIRCHSCS